MAYSIHIVCLCVCFSCTPAQLAAVAEAAASSSKQRLDKSASSRDRAKRHVDDAAEPSNTVAAVDQDAVNTESSPMQIDDDDGAAAADTSPSGGNRAADHATPADADDPTASRKDVIVMDVDDDDPAVAGEQAANGGGGDHDSDHAHDASAVSNRSSSARSKGRRKRKRRRASAAAAVVSDQNGAEAPMESRDEQPDGDAPVTGATEEEESPAKRSHTEQGEEHVPSTPVQAGSSGTELRFAIKYASMVLICMYCCMA